MHNRQHQAASLPQAAQQVQHSWGIIICSALQGRKGGPGPTNGTATKPVQDAVANTISSEAALQRSNHTCVPAAPNGLHGSHRCSCVQGFLAAALYQALCWRKHTQSLPRQHSGILAGYRRSVRVGAGSLSCILPCLEARAQAICGLQASHCR